MKVRWPGTYLFGLKRRLINREDFKCSTAFVCTYTAIAKQPSRFQQHHRVIYNPVILVTTESSHSQNAQGQFDGTSHRGQPIRWGLAFLQLYIIPPRKLNLSPSTTPTMAASSRLSKSPHSSPPPELGKFLRRISNSRREVLEYNCGTQSLSTWNWWALGFMRSVVLAYSGIKANRFSHRTTYDSKGALWGRFFVWWI